MDEATRYNLIFLFIAILDQDIDRVVDRLVDLGVVGTTLQLERLKRSLDQPSAIGHGRWLRADFRNQPLSPGWLLGEGHPGR